LPGALIIAHEVGHVLEDDFSLTAEIRAALDGAGLRFADVWKGWAREMFADVYGCCAMGPAFAGAMIDLNATKVNSVQIEERTYGKYPTRNLRIWLLCETLRLTAHAADADRLRAGWELVYGKIAKMLDYRDELPKVVAALIAGPYRGKTLTGIIDFPANWAPDIRQIGQRAAQGLPLSGHTDPRKLFAAAQWLHENAAPGVDMRKAQQNLVNQIVARSSSTERALRGLDPQEEAQDKQQAEARLQQLEATDRARGAKLRSLLLTTKPEADPPPAGAPPGRPGS